MAHTITLRNRSARTLNVHVPELGRERHEVGTNDRNKATGEVGRRELVRFLPKALTLLPKGMAGDTVTDLPSEAATSPEITWAVQRGDLECVSVSTSERE